MAERTASDFNHCLTLFLFAYNSFPLSISLKKYLYFGFLGSPFFSGPPS